MDGNHQLKVVGELKVPWIREHNIRKSYYRRVDLRKIFAQPIHYMQALGCVYGFLSNYDETIFLRQIVDKQGVWRIKYSPVIPASIAYKSSDVDPVVSVRQCFLCRMRCYESGAGS